MILKWRSAYTHQDNSLSWVSFLSNLVKLVGQSEYNTISLPQSNILFDLTALYGWRASNASLSAYSLRLARMSNTWPIDKYGFMFFLRALFWNEHKQPEVEFELQLLISFFMLLTIKLSHTTYFSCIIRKKAKLYQSYDLEVIFL